MFTLELKKIDLLDLLDQHSKTIKLFMYYHRRPRKPTKSDNRNQNKSWNQFIFDISALKNKIKIVAYSFSVDWLIN